jgi:outer membrane protein insertion porin family
VRVIVRGAREFPSERIRLWATGADGLRRVGSAYADAGFWSAAVRDTLLTTLSGERIREIHVSEGGIATVTLAVIRLRNGIPDTSRERLPTFRSTPDAIYRLLRHEADNGHPFAEAVLVSAHESAPASFIIDTRLYPGEEVRIARIVPRGNTVTKAGVIARELRRPTGSLYSQRDVDRWKRRLERSQYFETVGDPALAWSDSANGTADLLITVTEGRPNRFEGVVGYQPGEGNKRGEFTGLADITLGNLLGTGRRLSVLWNRPRASETSLDLAFREPWIAGYPVDGEARFAVDQRPEYALERVEATLGGELVPDVLLQASIGREIVRSDSIPLLGGPRYRSLMLRGEAEYDTRDNPENPTRGIKYKVNWRYDVRRNRVFDPDFLAWYGGAGWQQKERISLVRVDLDHYIPVRRTVVAALGWHGGQISTTSGRATFSAADELRLGGALTMRGYRQNQFAGDRVIWGNHELRYLLGGAARAFVFVDAGYVRTRRVDSQTGAFTVAESYPVAYGTGLRARTATGTLGIDFGWGRHDTFAQGKVHARIETTF